MTAAPLARLEASVYRYPIAVPVRTSFGVMRERPAVFVRAEDRDGFVGWGEAWCNFPSVGAEHRARIVNMIVAPLVIGHDPEPPEAVFRRLSAALAVLAIQSGESGPIAQAIAGVDIALWDLHARRVGEPLWRLLGGASPEIAVYASGINPVGSAEAVAGARTAGHTAFKLKIGFGEETDRRNLGAIRDLIGPDAHLAADANQAWSLEQAREAAATLDAFGLAWLEEPLRADRPWTEWRALAEGAGTPPLAAGENIAGCESFDRALASGALRVVQPDLAKWGGFSGCLPVAREILRSGAAFCPHYLGAGIGLVASAHLLAAAGGGGMLEMDINDNALRDMMLPGSLPVTEGRTRLPDAPGLGFKPDVERLQPYRVHEANISKH